MANTFHLSDVPLMEFGNERQLAGAVYVGKGQTLVLIFPDEDGDPDTLMRDVAVAKLDAPTWERLLNQTDQLNVEGPNKAILRKSQRQIDSNISWAVYRRDGYRCRYCGDYKPLSVDHVDLWESGGVSVAENLISSCKPCNRLRGNREYDAWLDSNDYKQRSSRLNADERALNEAVRKTLPYLQSLRVQKQRSR